MSGLVLSLQQIVDAIVVRAEAIHPEVLNVYGEPVGAPQFPALVVAPPRFDPTLAMKRGVLKLVFPLWLMQSISAGNDEAQASLWPYIDWSGDQSIIAAFDADPSLGFGSFADGTNRVDARIIDEIEPPDLIEIAGTQAFGETFPLTVHVTNRE